MFRMLFECSTTICNALRMQLNYTSNTVRYFSASNVYLESFEHAQNIPTGRKNVPECLKCTRNSARMFRMHFDCTRMHNEF